MIPVLVVVSVIFAFVICVSIAQHIMFNKRFPPISDAEFVARCTPGTHPDVALRVRAIIAEFYGIDAARIYPSTRFVEDLEEG